MTCITSEWSLFFLTRPPSFPAVVVWRHVFLQIKSSRSVIPCRTVDQTSIDVKEVDPNFVMAALICVSDAQHVKGDSKSAVHADVPFFFRTRWF